MSSILGFMTVCSKSRTKPTRICAEIGYEYLWTSSTDWVWSLGPTGSVVTRSILSINDLYQSLGLGVCGLLDDDSGKF